MTSVCKLFEKNQQLLRILWLLLATREHWLGHLPVPDFLLATGFHAYVIQNLMFHIRNCYKQSVDQQLSNLRHFSESQAYRECIEMPEDCIYDKFLCAVPELETVLRHLRSESLNILFAWT